MAIDEALAGHLSLNDVLSTVTGLRDEALECHE